MKSKIISIITDWNRELGTGHIQRMAALTDFINTKIDLKAYIINAKNLSFLSPSIELCRADEIVKDTDLIIRDMRDSSVKEIQDLKKISDVLVIDDNGPGRKISNYKTDILPNIKYDDFTHEFIKNNFIYGYNFVNSLRKINKNDIKKDIDFSIYLGHHINEEIINNVIDSLPHGSLIAFLIGDRSFLIKNGVRREIGLSYSEIILSSRILITHFGITLFEGLLCNCRIITLNPAKYHSDLTDSIKNIYKITNAGILGRVDLLKIKSVFKETLDKTETHIKLDKLTEKIESNLKSFTHNIEQILKENNE